MLYGSGLRRAELVRCDAADLDLARGLLLIRSGKGRKDRIVPVGGRALLALGVYLDEARPDLEQQPTPALFLTRYGLRMDVQSVNLRVRWHARVARVQATPHVLRHSCATHLLRGGADVRHVQRLLGHKRVVTTALYTRVAAADLRAVFSRSHPRREAPALAETAPITSAVLREAFARAHPRRSAGEPVEG
jgi:site-specific recombinase XerD